MALYYSDDNKNLIKVAGNFSEPNVEHSEVIYDKDSTDSNINWGYTNGIATSRTVSGKDFSKYKKLRVQCGWTEIDAERGTFYIDLQRKPFASAGGYRGSVVFYTGLDAQYDLWTKFCNCEVSDDKTSFTCVNSGLRTQNGYTHNYIAVLEIEGIY